MCRVLVVIFFFKQKTAYELRISDWSSDVCLPISRSSILPVSIRRSVIYPAPNKGPAYLVPRTRIDLGRICSVGPLGTRILTRRIAVTRHEAAVHVALLAVAGLDLGFGTGCFPSTPLPRIAQPLCHVLALRG